MAVEYKVRTEGEVDVIIFDQQALDTQGFKAVEVNYGALEAQIFVPPSPCKQGGFSSGYSSGFNVYDCSGGGTNAAFTNGFSNGYR